MGRFIWKHGPWTDQPDTESRTQVYDFYKDLFREKRRPLRAEEMLSALKSQRGIVGVNQYQIIEQHGETIAKATLDHNAIPHKPIAIPMTHQIAIPISTKNYAGLETSTCGEDSVCSLRPSLERICRAWTLTCLVRRPVAHENDLTVRG